MNVGFLLRTTALAGRRAWVRRNLAPPPAGAGRVANFRVVSGGSDANLTWDPVTDATGYVIQRNDKASWVDVTTLGAVTSHVVTGLTADTTEWYRAIAIVGGTRQTPSISDFARPGPLLATTATTSIVSGEVTFTVAEDVTGAAVQAGTFENGEPFIVLPVGATNGVTISAVSPASGLDANGLVQNGMMRDPLVNGGKAGFEGQGFDQLMASGTGGPSTVTWDASKNVTLPVTVTPGTETTFVKSIRQPGAAAHLWTVIKSYTNLHILKSAPRVGSLPPDESRAQNDKRIKQLPQWWPDLQLAAGNGGTAGYTTLMGVTPPKLWIFGNAGDSARRMRLDEHYSGQAGAYGGTITREYSQLPPLWLSAGLTDQQRYDVAWRLAQWGEAIEAYVSRGVYGNNSVGGRGYGAGNNGATEPWRLIGGVITWDADMVTAVKSWSNQGTGTSFWVTAKDLKLKPALTNSGDSGQPYYEDMIGTPWFESSGVVSDTNSRYFNEGRSVAAHESLAMAVMPAGPTGETGVQVVCQGAPVNDTSVKRTSAVAILWRFRTQSPGHTSGQFRLTENWNAMFDAFKDRLGTPWDGKPSQVVTPKGMTNSYFSVTDGTLSWNLDANGTYNWSTSPITQVDLRYSVGNNVQYIEKLNVGRSGSVPIAPGATVYAGLRVHNAHGAGPWSSHHRHVVDNGDPNQLPHRNVLTIPGTPVASAPTLVTNPALHQRIYGQWKYELWRPIVTQMTEDSLTLRVGNGEWSGYPFPTFTYSIEVSADGVTGWTQVSATDRYVVTSNEKNKYLRGKITATNASGAVTYTTEAVLAPAIKTLPANVLIDASFGERFAYDYPGHALIAHNNSNPAHVPSQAFSSADVSDGAIAANTTNSYGQARVAFPGYILLEPGKAYRVRAKMVTNDRTGPSHQLSTFNAQTNGGFPYVVDGSNFTTVSPAKKEEVAVHDAVYVLPLSMTPTPIGFHFAENTGVGGTQQGPWLTEVYVEKTSDTPELDFSLAKLTRTARITSSATDSLDHVPNGGASKTLTVQAQATFASTDTGIIAEFGGSVYGMSIYAHGGKLHFTAGDGTAVGTATTRQYVTWTIPAGAAQTRVITVQTNSLAGIANNMRVHIDGVYVGDVYAGSIVDVAGGDLGGIGKVHGNSTAANAGGWTATGSGAFTGTIDWCDVYADQVLFA